MDFSILTDDQLIELLRAAFSEATRRGVATAAAANSVLVDADEAQRVAAAAAKREAERLRIAELERIAKEAAEQVQRQSKYQAAQTEAEKEAAKQRRQWGMQKALALTLKDLFASLDISPTMGTGWSITVWKNSDKTEKRVYIDGPAFGRGSRNRGAGKFSFFVTGNARQAPGSMTTEEIANYIAWCAPATMTETEKQEKAKLLRERMSAFCKRAAAEWNQMKMDCDTTAAADVEPIGPTTLADMMAAAPATGAAKS